MASNEWKPDIDPGNALGFWTTSKNGKRYINLTYIDKNGTEHHIALFQNTSGKGKEYFSGPGDIKGGGKGSVQAEIEDDEDPFGDF